MSVETTFYPHHHQNLSSLHKFRLRTQLNVNYCDLLAKLVGCQWRLPSTVISQTIGYEDLWKQVFPVGTEWDQLALLSEYKWNFSNLEVVSHFPPSDKIGINSVQRESEEILDMKQMKMDWAKRELVRLEKVVKLQAAIRRHLVRYLAAGTLRAERSCSAYMRV
ncbi:hypothetical protein L1887_25130 [Cichorium endivia]|nr:hypothetical protein L1887_25130 [Cichorium endivia]